MDLVNAFEGTREALLREADAIPPELRTTPFVGHWNLMDLLAHLVGWDYTNIEAIEQLGAGLTPTFYSHYDPGWAAYNQQLIDRYGGDDWQALRDALVLSQGAVVAKLRLLPATEMAREHRDPGRRRPMTVAGILRAAIRDEREHLVQVRAFGDSQRMGRG